MTTISIVIPAYNAESFLAPTLDSVVAQTVSDWELIIVDDGSRDATAALVEGYASRDSRIKLLRRSNGGVARARNAGAAARSNAAAYTIFLDHDDLWRPNTLETLIRTLDSNPDAVGAHGMARKIDAHGNPLGDGNCAIQNFNRRKYVQGRTVDSARDEPTTAAMVVYDNLICTPGVCLVRSRALAQLAADPEQIFDPGAAPLDDWDFWLRLTRQGDLAYVDTVVLDWRRHAAAGSQDISAMSAAELRIRERLRRSDLPPDLREIAELRYRKLLVTRRRRDARDQFQTARTHVREGRLGSGVAAWSTGLKSYLGYLRERKTIP